MHPKYIATRKRAILSALFGAGFTFLRHAHMLLSHDVNPACIALPPEPNMRFLHVPPHLS